MQERYISFFTDYGFKRLFGSEPTEICLIDFLNSLLDGKESPIVDLQYRNPENLDPNELDRKGILDFYCFTSDGTRFVVELQKAKQKFFKDRALFYSTFPLQEQALKGEWDVKLGKVYTVAILDFDFKEDADHPEKYFYEIKHKVTETNKGFYDKLTFIYLAMRKFKKKPHELQTSQDKWLYAIKHLSELETIPEELNSEVFGRFFSLAEIAKLNPRERQGYEQSLKYYRDLNNVIATAFDKGKEEGKTEGKAEGLAKGKLMAILELRFDTLAEGQLQKINSATLDQLNRWILKAKSARSSIEVFS